MLKRIDSRIAHYAALLVSSSLALALAGGANLNCASGPSPKTVASSSVRDREFRDPEGGALLDVNNPRPFEVEFSKTVTLSSGTEVPVTGWKPLSGALTFDDPANPNVGTVTPRVPPPPEGFVYVELEFRYPVSGAKGTMEYMLRVRSE